MLKYFTISSLFVRCAMAEEAPQAVVTIKVDEGTLAPTMYGVGVFKAYADALLNAETAGRIEQIHFNEGYTNSFTRCLHCFLFIIFFVNNSCRLLKEVEALYDAVFLEERILGSDRADEEKPLYSPTKACKNV